MNKTKKQKMYISVLLSNFSSFCACAKIGSKMIERYFCPLWLLHTGRGNACRAAKCDAIANKLTAPNMFIGYRVSFCRAASVSASSMKKSLNVAHSSTSVFSFLMGNTNVELWVTSKGQKYIQKYIFCLSNVAYTFHLLLR